MTKWAERAEEWRGSVNEKELQKKYEERGVEWDETERSEVKLNEIRARSIFFAKVVSLNVLKWLV